MSGQVDAAELAQAVSAQADRVLGFKQLPVYYRVGGNLINPADAFATLAAAIAQGRSTLDLVPGRLAARRPCGPELPLRRGLDPLGGRLQGGRASSSRLPSRRGPSSPPYFKHTDAGEPGFS